MRTPIYKSRPVAPYPARFEAERINDFIVMSEGYSNTYLIETPEGSILVNAGMGFEAPVHYENYQGESTQASDIKYLITTQSHPDHIGGVQFFRDISPDLTYIAHAGGDEHKAYEARLTEFRSRRFAFRFREEFDKTFSYYAAHGYTKLNKQDSPTPDLTFEHRHEFSLGGLDVVLIAAKGAETNDSLIVWLPQHKICLTGNLFGCPFGHFPNLVTIRGDRYRDALTCAAAAQTVLDLEAELILYGHHAPIAGKELIKAEVTAYRDAILYVHDETVKGMNEGKDLHTLMRDIQLPAECEVGQGYGKVSWSVRAIWESYTGWFHHQSTTELYSVPQRTINRDLIELAGADNLIERAQGKFADNQPEQALHLLDIVLAEDPDAEEAKALAIAIHEKLLSESENFWLSGWLENRIKLLKGGNTAPLTLK